MKYPFVPKRVPVNTSWRTEQVSIGDILEPREGAPLVYELPVFQRPFNRTPEQVCSILQSLFDSEAPTPIVVWSPAGTGRHLLLDGQHRLVSIGARVVSSSGAPRTAPQVRFNVMTLRWEPGRADGENTFGTDVMFDPWFRWSTNITGDVELRRHLSACCDRHANLSLSVVRCYLPESAAAWGEAASYFERLALSVPFTADELGALRCFVNRADVTSGGQAGR